MRHFITIQDINESPGNASDVQRLNNIKLIKLGKLIVFVNKIRALVSVQIK